MKDQRIKEILIEKDRVFKNLFLKHQDFEEELNKYEKLDFKSNEEMIQYNSLKRQKLKVKDKMQNFIIEFRKRIDS